MLELSYEYLPTHLKRCFLYFGAFPEDATIHTPKLIWLWIAEGFIPKQEEICLEDLAEEYLSDLINRSLVMTVKRRFDVGIKACSIHDLLHDMCLRKAHEENFLKTITEEFSIYEKHQRLCVYPAANNSKKFGLHCRSFIGRLSDIFPIFSNMPLLRVVDEHRVIEDMVYVIEEINILVNLKYLSILKLPRLAVDNLVNLEILYVKTNKDFMLSSILKMVKLRHLHTRSGFKIKKDYDTDQTTKLVSLGIVDIKDHDDEEILRRSPHLRRLKCECEGTAFPDPRSLTQLESLNISFMVCYEGELTKIYFPSTIIKLTLSQIGLPWQELSIIGRLPNLCSLRLHYEPFKGEEWVTKDGEFKKLRFLTVEHTDLKQWITSNEHFPKLQRLVLQTCQELHDIPNELGDISALQTIEVTSCSYEASISAVRIEIEQREYGNEELKVIINNSDWSKEQLMRECEEE